MPESNSKDLNKIDFTILQNNINKRAESVQNQSKESLSKHLNKRTDSIGS